MSISRKILVTAAAVAAALAAGCGGQEEATGTASAPPVAQPPSTEQIELQAATSAALEPISASESAWQERVHAYAERLDADITRGGVVTHTVMRRSAKLYTACAPMLERAGDPGRFAPVAPQVERACTRLAKAARLLGQAVAASEAGGSVVAGTPEERRFNRALSGAFEAAGNAQYDLQRALEKAAAIEAELEA